ncbi:hypothetical protein [Hymenobacter metallicola]|uniref:Uncharacterized protein n=1 Tax=Hymenobacter metallicola TaxID=2563114 RepID=A0A4Z0QJQ1_9BACT|nr:hypothetical protein [Hymenobacter metallicola]TGE29746.1 hypothetical protein E5K02_09885 [Hymenobacter metallicola]
MRYFLFLALALASCTTTRHAEQPDVLSLLTPDILPPTSELPDSLPKQGSSHAPPDRPGFVKRTAAKVVAAVKGSGKFKNKGTIIYQVGASNTASSATKPGTMATGTGASATDVKKADGPIQVGRGNQATDNSKAGQRGGAAATGEGSTLTAPTAPTTWWKWLLLGLGLGFLAPKVVMKFIPSLFT